MENKLKHNIDRDFTVVSNILLKSKLSAKAKGIFVQIISLPENWNFSVAGLATLFSDGEKSVKAGLDELVQAGFLIWERKRGQNGRWTTRVTTVYPRQLHAKKPHGETSTGQKATWLEEDNKELTNKELNINKELNNNIIVSDKKDKKIKEAKKVLSEFKKINEFWSKLSGRKLSDNQTSREAFRKLRKEHSVIDIMFAIRGAVYYQGKKYKPQVLSFASLYQKWDSLTGHMITQKEAKNEIPRF